MSELRRDLRSGPAHLLVVDDNKVNRLLLTRSLELQGHSVALAENGRVALEMLRRDGFDLILLDMEMPEMDGFQVLEQLAKDLQLRDLGSGAGPAGIRIFAGRQARTRVGDVFRHQGLHATRGVAASRGDDRA